ncbi:sulfatase family protein [Cyclobacterium qasimii]|nr:sulfatase [Cyclobacterium qasimii]
MISVKYLIASLIFMFLFIGSKFGSAEELPEKPNFIVFYVDNLGYGDIGPFGSVLNRTPNLDQLGKEGTLFTHFYSTSGVCSPSRSSLMTGCYPRRVNLHLSGNGGRVLRPVEPVGLNPDEISIARSLKNLGYVTGIIGKWHLGDQKPFLPTSHGFDFYFGIPYSDDMTQEHEKERIPNAPKLPLMRNDKVIEAPVDRDYMTQRETGEAIKFIQDNKSQPFFLYLPQSMPGSTLAPFSSPGFKGKSKNAAWGDAVEELDWSAGEIINTLKQLGLDEKTIVIWTSDNGAPKRDPVQGSNLPLGGWGYTTAEGGQRVPMIAWCPGVIPQGRVNKELATTMDLYVTFTKWAGGDIPNDRIIDGKDIKELLLGSRDAKSLYEAFYYYDGPQLQAVRKGPWKLYLPLEKKIFTKGGQDIQLFNVENDPGETNNVIVSHSHLKSEMMAYAEKARIDLGDSDGIENRIGAGQRPVGRVDHPVPQEMILQ